MFSVKTQKRILKKMEKRFSKSFFYVRCLDHSITKMSN